jgi:hypothetical protein
MAVAIVTTIIITAIDEVVDGSSPYPNDIFR